MRQFYVTRGGIDGVVGGDVEIVHLGERKERIAEAERHGVRSVPALVLGGEVFHINHGADLSALR